MRGSMMRIDIELMKTIEPPPCAFMCGMTACVSWSEPKTLTSKICRQSSRSASLDQRLDAALEGVVDQHVDAAELGVRGVDEPLAVLGRGDVGRHARAPAGRGRAPRPPPRRASSAPRAASTTCAPSRAQRERDVARPCRGRCRRRWRRDRRAACGLLECVGQVRSGTVTSVRVRAKAVDLVDQLVARAAAEADAAVLDAELLAARGETRRAPRREPVRAFGAERRRTACRRRATALFMPISIGASPRVLGAVLADGGDRCRHAHLRHALRQPAVAALGGAPQRRRGRAADPDRRPRLLHRPRPQADVVHRPGRPVVTRDTRRGRRRRSRSIASSSSAPRRVKSTPSAANSRLEVTRADAEDHAAARQRVERGERLRGRPADGGTARRRRTTAAARGASRRRGSRAWRSCRTRWSTSPRRARAARRRGRTPRRRRSRSRSHACGDAQHLLGAGGRLPRRDEHGALRRDRQLHAVDERAGGTIGRRRRSRTSEQPRRARPGQRRADGSRSVHRRRGRAAASAAPPRDARRAVHGSLSKRGMTCLPNSSTESQRRLLRLASRRGCRR